MPVLLERPAVAKKKAARKPGRPPSPRGPRMHVLGIRAHEDWKEWLTRFAELNRSDMVDLIDDALEAYAKLKRFDPPPRR
jgi:hypothetical protein